MSGAAHKIGILGGSFDPPHLGHLLLAQDAAEFLALDKVLFIPAAAAPLKPAGPTAPAESRLAMIRAAVAAHGQPAWEVSDWEIRQGGTSYSYHTAQYLRTLHPDAELYWLIGADQLRQLDHWHRAAELCELVQFAIADRSQLLTAAPAGQLVPQVSKPACGACDAATAAHAPAAAPARARIVHLPCRNVDISSTEIRTRLRDGLPVDLFLPESVLRLIQRQSLYH
jgi:nicotinate-nucleotide adenylyltransferase